MLKLNHGTCPFLKCVSIIYFTEFTQLLLSLLTERWMKLFCSLWYCSNRIESILPYYILLNVPAPTF